MGLLISKKKNEQKRRFEGMMQSSEITTSILIPESEKWEKGQANTGLPTGSAELLSCSGIDAFFFNKPKQIGSSAKDGQYYEIIKMDGSFWKSA